MLNVTRPTGIHLQTRIATYCVWQQRIIISVTNRRLFYKGHSMTYNLKFPLPDGAFSDMSIWLARQDPAYYVTGKCESVLLLKYGHVIAEVYLEM